MEQSAHAEKLLALKMRDQDLSGFNDSFTKLAIAARPVMGDYGVNRCYT